MTEATGNDDHSIEAILNLVSSSADMELPTTESSSNSLEISGIIYFCILINTTGSVGVSAFGNGLDRHTEND